MQAKLMPMLVAVVAMARADWLADANRALEADALRDAESVLRAAEKSLGPRANCMARAELLNAWSAVHLKLGQVAAAETDLRDALRILGGDPQGGDLRPTVLHNLAAVEMRTGRYADALSDESAAMRGFAKSLPPNHPTAIRGWASLASLQYMMGKPAEARISMDRAIASAEIAYGPWHPLLADLLRSEAVVLDKLQLHREARRARSRAAAISPAAGPQASATWDARGPSPQEPVCLYSK